METLKQLKAVEHTWEGHALVIKATQPDTEVADILQALGIRLSNSVLSVTYQTAA